MQIELQQRDFHCLEAICDAGGYATLSDCLFHLYKQAVVLSYEEFCESFTRLLQGEFISECFSIKQRKFRITGRGRDALFGDKKVFEEREIFKPFQESEFVEARVNGLMVWKQWQDGTLRSKTFWDVLSIVLLLLSLAFLAGGITFACLYQGLIGWRIGIGIAGGILYMVVGTVDEFLVAPKCSGRMESFLAIANFPSYALLTLILLGLSAGA